MTEAARRAGESGRPGLPALLRSALPLVLFLVMLPALAAASGDLPAPWTGPEGLGKGAAGRPAVVFFHTPWCFFCKKMKQRVLNQPAVLAALERGGLLAVSVDLDRNPSIKTSFAVGKVPTLIFLAPDGRQRLRLEGFVGQERFLEALASASAAAVRH